MKKRLTVVLAVLCVLAFTAPAFAAQPEIFADVPAKHWAYEAVYKLAQAGIVSGDKGRFSGDNTITRYEMAVMVANAMTKWEKADSEQKALIEKLQREFNADLVKLGARVAKVEAKAKVNFFFDNRLEATTTSLGKTAGGGITLANGAPANISDKTQFMERIRVYMNVPVGDKWDWNARFHQTKWNFRQDNYATANTSLKEASMKFDRFWLTGKDLFGKDSGTVEVGKMWLYPGKGSFYGNTGDTEGLYYTKAFDKLSMRVGSGSNLSEDVSFAELTYRPTKTMDIGAYVLKHDVGWAGIKDDINLLAINGAWEIPNAKGLALSFEWAKNRADDSDGSAILNPYTGFKGDQSGYFIALQSKYRATNFMPALYTSMVNPFVKGDHGWGISYRHLPAGVAGSGNRGAFNWMPLTTDTKGYFQNAYNNVNAWRFDYIYVPWKNVQWTLTYDRIKPISGDWTNHSIQSTFNFFF